MRRQGASIFPLAIRSDRMTILRSLKLGCCSRLFLLVALLVCKVLASVLSSEAVLLDKIVAVVNGEVLTLSDFDNHLALLTVFQPSQDEPDRDQAFQRFIDQTLLRQEALRTKIVEVEELEVAQQLRAVEQRSGGREGLAEVMQERGLSLARVHVWLRHQLIVRAFIDRRVHLFVRVSDSEIVRYYQEHQHAIGEPLSTETHEQIRRLLAAQQENARVAQLIEELKRKANLQFPP